MNKDKNNTPSQSNLKPPAKIHAFTPPIEIRRAILEDIHRMSVAEQQRIANYGKVKPEIAIKYKDYQFVAVGNQLFYSKSWTSFADFLIGYVPEVFDKKWWAAEIAKPLAERNQVCTWWEAMRQFAKTQPSVRTEPLL